MPIPPTAIALLVLLVAAAGPIQGLRAGEAPTGTAKPGVAKPGTAKPGTTGATASASAEPPPPVTFRLEAGDGGQYSFKPDVPTELSGGVQIWYDRIHLHGDSLHYWEAPLEGARRPLLVRALFAPGPKGPKAGGLVLDSRECSLPSIGFRGLLTPSRLEVTRQPPDPSRPGVARFLIDLPAVGFFSGEILTSTGWAAHAGWADRIEMVALADLVGGALTALRFETIHLFGRPAADGKEKERARIVRSEQSVKDPKALQALGSDAVSFSLESMSISMEFDAQGAFLRFRPGLDTRIHGTPSGDMPIESRSRVSAGE